MQQNLVFDNFSVDVEDQVVQVLLDLAGPSSPDEFRTEAAAVSNLVIYF